MVHLESKNLRAWRKLHASLLDSDSIAQLSDPAIVLLMFLIVAQDDSGYYPWTKPKVARLTVTRPDWTEGVVLQYAEELVATGIAKWEEGGILLAQGTKFNGNLRSDRTPDLYQRHTTGIPLTYQRHTTDIPVVNPEKSRVEKSRVEKEENKASPSKKKKLVSLPKIQETHEVFLERMALKYPSLQVSDELERCQSYWEAKGKEANRYHVMNWLKKAVEIQVEHQQRNNHDGADDEPYNPHI